MSDAAALRPCRLCRDSCEIELRNGKGRAPCPRCQAERFFNEMVQRYVASVPAAVSGQGGHTQTFKLALAFLKGFDLTIEQARPYLLEYNQRCEPPWSAAELEHKLVSASAQPDERAPGWLRPNFDIEVSKPYAASKSETPKPDPRPEFRHDKLAQFAARWRAFSDTAWLADRSAIDPCGVTASEFLGRLYTAGEHSVIFTKPFSQGQALWPIEKFPKTGKNGVWFLAQPVDGKLHPNPRSINQATGEPNPSRRSEESVTAWRYLVLESDKADPRDWLAALVQLPLALAAIYTSAKRSIHALVKVPAPSLAEWRRFSAAVKPILVTLGADQQVVASAVRLTRLPGCWREGWFDEEKVYHRFDKPRLQKLLYLNPYPAAVPICSLPRQRDVLAPIVREAEALLTISADQVIERADQVIERAGAADLDQAIKALQEHENIPRDVDRCVRRLTWFEAVPRASELLDRLRRSAAFAKV